MVYTYAVLNLDNMPLIEILCTAAIASLMNLFNLYDAININTLQLYDLPSIPYALREISHDFLLACARDES